MAEIGEARGRGIYKFSKGILIEGYFSNGLPNGSQIRISYSDGAIYEGGIVNGKKDGRGKFIYADKAVFIGDYK